MKYSCTRNSMSSLILPDHNVSLFQIHGSAPYGKNQIIVERADLDDAIYVLQQAKEQLKEQ